MAGYTPSKLGGAPIARVDRYSGTDTDYKAVVTWTCTKGKRGELKEVSMVSDNYTKTRFKLVIGGTTEFEDKTIQAPLSLPFPDNRGVPSEQSVILYAKSSDGTSIKVDGSLTGKEV